ncbi:hypothetical protein ACHAXS_006440 [Conticribra weissflogii]
MEPMESRDRITDRFLAYTPRTAPFIIAATLAFAFATSEARIHGSLHTIRKLQPDAVGKDAYTELQCEWWQTMGLGSDVDFSGGLDQGEFLSFLNKISLDHFLANSDPGNRSWQNLFYELAKVDQVAGNGMLQVSTGGFFTAKDDKDVDPKIQKENEKYRDKFCKSVFEGMLNEGVEVETMDLAIFTYGLFETPTVSGLDNILMSTTTPATTMAKTTTFITTKADGTVAGTEENLTTASSPDSEEILTTTTSSIGEVNSSTTNSFTTDGNPTTSTVPTKEGHLPNSIGQDHTTATTSPKIISTEQPSNASSSTASLPPTTTATTNSPTTWTSLDTLSFGETSPTIITAITSPATTAAHPTFSTTKALNDFKTSSPKTILETNPASTTMISSTEYRQNESKPTTTSASAASAASSSREGELTSDIEKAIQVAASVEQVVIRSAGERKSKNDNQIRPASTGMIVGAIAGIGSAVVLIVTAVTRHPYFDPSY